MYLIAAGAGNITAHQAGTYLWRGFKAPIMAVYDFIRYQTAASSLELLYQVGIILFYAVLIAVLYRLSTRATWRRRRRLVA